MPPASSPTSGVIYARNDLAGLPRRLVIIAVDGSLLLASLIALIAAASLAEFLVPTRRAPLVLLLNALWFAGTFTYLTLLKAHWGTLGYLAAGTRIVDLTGRRPSFWKMTGRLASAALLGWLAPGQILGPCADLMWITCDPHRQSLHDKLAGTYVVKRRATPAAPGRLGTTQLQYLSLALRVPDVRPQP